MHAAIKVLHPDAAFKFHSSYCKAGHPFQGSAVALRQVPLQLTGKCVCMRFAKSYDPLAHTMRTDALEQSGQHSERTPLQISERPAHLPGPRPAALQIRSSLIKSHQQSASMPCTSKYIILTI